MLNVDMGRIIDLYNKKYISSLEAYLDEVYSTCKDPIVLRCIENYDKSGDVNLLVKSLIKINKGKVVTTMLKVYTDGSYNINTKAYGWAYAIYMDGFTDEKGNSVPAHYDSGMGTGDAAAMRNVAGELSAIMRAVKYLHNQHNVDGVDALDVEIIHDYEGAAFWINGKWKAKKPETKAYVEFMHKYMNTGKLNIKFTWAKGHSGVPGNEMVDRLARKACGVDK